MKVGVIGAGQMGHGIAQVIAAAGIEVVLRDISEEFVQKGYQQIGKNLERLVGKGRLEAAEQDAILGRIATTTAIADLADVDLAIEAATENPEIKKKIFAELDATVKPGALLATNTSSISVTMIAAVTGRPESGDRHALHEPGAGDEAGGDHPRPADLRRHLPGDPRPHREGRQGAGAGRRLPGVHLQPGAAADDQRGGLLRVRGRRHRRGDRRGD